MLNAIKQFFEKQVMRPLAQASDEGGEHALRLATAALLAELARADFHASDTEWHRMCDLLAAEFSLTNEECAELLRLADEESQQATCMHDFVRAINEGFSAEEKVRVIELMWQLAYCDGILDKYEEHYIRRTADLLYVPHAQFMQAKHAAQAKR